MHNEGYEWGLMNLMKLVKRRWKKTSDWKKRLNSKFSVHEAGTYQRQALDEEVATNSLATAS